MDKIAESYSFPVFGHKNILATHKNTIEFTKDRSLTANGDCILGIKADFDLYKLRQFLSADKVRIIIAVDSISETITATPNKNFDDNKEMVIRVGDFTSERTFAVRADKAAKHLSRDLVNLLRKGRQAAVTLSGI
ncbi:DUF371 domain-containing protein [Candidatus Woesearchaeota archaeon]|nr:DUF371 domain-containing protein [Candidatus Woesearchaeota archaeon]